MREKEALDTIGFDWIAEHFHGKTSLHADNLDSDHAAERLITLENAVAVMKHV